MFWFKIKLQQILNMQKSAPKEIKLLTYISICKKENLLRIVYYHVIQLYPTIPGP